MYALLAANVGYYLLNEFYKYWCIVTLIYILIVNKKIIYKVIFIINLCTLKCEIINTLSILMYESHIISKLVQMVHLCYEHLPALMIMLK